MATVANNSSRSSLFVNSPGKARATIPGHGVNADGPQGKIVGGFLKKKENQFLPRPRETRLKGILHDISLNQTDPEPAPPVQQNLASSHLKIDFQSIAEPAALAGRLRLFLPNWQKITVDPAILYRRCAGLQARIPVTPNARIYSKSPTVFARGVGKDRLRGCYPTGKRSLEYGQAGFRPVFKQVIFGVQRGRKLSTGHKSKGTECISEIRSFQNGRHSSSPRFASASRLAGKNRFERRVLRDSSFEGSPEIPSVCLEGFSPRICVSSRWPSSDAIFRFVNGRCHHEQSLPTLYPLVSLRVPHKLHKQYKFSF